ncbi:MAG: choice-of-anchor J domain-containing protein [Muribaculaceae bacterium]|nr:choice-of-anchor J domain-containing protein [Muribaculaceae bacterium]
MRTVLTRILSSALIASVATTAWAETEGLKKVFDGPNPYRIEAASLKNAPVRVGRRGYAGFEMRDVSLLSQRASMTKVPFKAATSMPKIVGAVIASDSWNTTANVGLYTIPTAKDQTFTEVIKGLDASYGGVLVEDTYWAVGTKAQEDGNYFWISGYDINSGEEVASYAVTNYLQLAGGGMTYDASTQTVYALSYTDQNMNKLALVKLKFGPTSATATKIANVADQYACIAAAADGTLYGVLENDAKTSTLVKINKTTGVATPAVTDSKTGKAVTTGIKPWDSASAIIDNTGRMFWTVYDAWYKGYIAEIDLKKGTATKLYDFPGNEWVLGLAIKPTIDAGVPNVATDLALTYDKGSLKGKLTFMAPANTYDGKAGTGALTYVVECNGQVISTGPTVYGAKVIVDYNVPVADNYTFVVYFTNAKGQGPKVTISKFIGEGIPTDTEFVTLTYVGGRMTVEWAAVKTSTDGGYIDPAKVTYTVTPYYNGVKDASKAVTTNELMWAERITEPQGTYETYAYGVTASYKDAQGTVSTSKEVKSNTVALGYYNTPYTNTFATAADFSTMTVIDANDDNKAWTYYAAYKAARISYNTSLDMDDWMITPPVRLEKGKTYKLSFDTYAYKATYPERIEVKVGTAPTAAAMTTTVVEPTVVAVPREDAITPEGYFTAEATGNYYFGFHGISDANELYLYVTNINIAEGEANVPAAVDNLVVTPALNGDLKVSVSFTAPSTEFSGAALTDETKITDIKISRNGSVLDQAVDFVDGVANYTFTDNVPAAGEYTYTVSCKNVNGWGIEESKTVYVGINYPEPVAAVYIEELSTPGEISIHWPAVTQTITGQPLEASDVTYTVTYWDYDGNTVSHTTSETAISVKMCEPEGQAFALASVVATTQRGDSEAVEVGPMPVGTAYTEYLNTFSTEDMNKYAYYLQSNLVSWYLSITGGPAGVDGDSNYLTCALQQTILGYIPGGSGKYVTGMISLKGMAAPKLSFYTYNIGGDDNTNTISVGIKTPQEEEFKILMPETTVAALGAQGEWSQVLLDLSAYAGKDVQVRLEITNIAYVSTLIDNLQVFSPLANDLEATINAPQIVNAGMDYTVQVDVKSLGYEVAKGYEVALYADNKLVDTKAGDNLSYLKSTTVDFNRTFELEATKPVLYKAVVNFKADENLTNNTTAEVSVTPVVDGSPVVTTLNANSLPTGVELTWTEPDTKNATPWQITEDFEDAAAYSNKFGDWTLIDLDESRNYTIEEYDFPSVPNGFLTQDVFGESKSGVKSLVSLAAIKGLNDDWAISPELSGKRQIVSFYVRSLNDTYGLESFEFLYSTKDTKPESFKLVEAISNVSTNWSQYAYIIPEGAKYFAVHCTSNDVIAFLLDDVSFTPKAMKAAYLAIKGYNVYRNGVKINDALVTDTKYLDTTAVDKTRYTYNVTVVYEKSVSGASNSVKIYYSEIDEITGNNLTIATENGAIIVNGAEGLNVSVVAVDGKVLYNGVGDARVDVLPGVYVVKAGEKVVKVLVK